VDEKLKLVNCKVFFSL